MASATTTSTESATAQESRLWTMPTIADVQKGVSCHVAGCQGLANMASLASGVMRPSRCANGAN